MKPCPMPKIGATVRLRGQRETATVMCHYTSVVGGVRLDKQLDGFYSWNKDDLVIVRQRSSRVHS